MKTIHQRLIVGIVCATILCVTGAGALLYHSLLNETNELADLQLHQLAVSLANGVSLEDDETTPEDPEEQFSIQAWKEDGSQVYADKLAPYPLINRLNLDGYTTLSFAGELWRLYGINRRGLYVQVAQPTRVRNQLAKQMALRSGLPSLIFAALLIALTLWVVRSALRPLNRLARLVADSSPSTQAKLSTDGWPIELNPIVKALNAFLEKFSAALEAQRVFVADAAHELRSPLTAMKLQLQLVEREADNDAKNEGLNRLHARLDRSSHLVQQLLNLASYEAGSFESQMTQVDMAEFLQEVVADHTDFAESRKIDLGLEMSYPMTLRIYREGVQVMLNNLIDNALRYTQRGGRVDVLAFIENDRAVLAVRDNGPGVAAEHHNRLFDRFFRIEGNEAPGCGLGLSIVRNIADHHDAEIQLLEGVDGQGLLIKVLFPQNR